MKKLQKIFFVITYIVCCAQFSFTHGQTSSPQNNVLPQFISNSLRATIDGQLSTDNSSICQNSEALLKMEASGGTSPYKFIYSINGNVQDTLTTLGSNNSATAPLPSDISGISTISLLKIFDANGDSIVFTDKSINVTILEAPIIKVSSNLQSTVVNGVTWFKVCTRTYAEFSIQDISGQSGLLYEIDWGDGDIIYVGNTLPTKTHEYYHRDEPYILTYKVTNAHGCSTSEKFHIYVRSNPAIALYAGGNNSICVNTVWRLNIIGTDKNTDDTKYIVRFNDGSPEKTYFQSDSYQDTIKVEHIFKKTSCGTNHNTGNTNYKNAFYASVEVVSMCNPNSGFIPAIYVSSAPESNFSFEKTTTCINTPICINSETSEGTLADAIGCFSSYRTVWEITRKDGYLAEGVTFQSTDSLGSLNGRVDYWLGWSKGSKRICPSFSIPGTYIVKMYVANKCGIDSITKEVCVESPIEPKFNFTSDSIGCNPLHVTLSNQTDTISNQCDGNKDIYWNIEYLPAHGGTEAGYEFTNGTSLKSFEPSIRFTKAGTYRLILYAKNSCDVQEFSRTIVVTQPPLVQIEDVEDICQPTEAESTIQPTANVINGGLRDDSELIYRWEFAGGTPSAFIGATPPTISYLGYGDFPVVLEVENECGISRVEKILHILPYPSIDDIDHVAICNGSLTDEIAFSGNDATEFFEWEIENFDLIPYIGLPSSGIGNIQPFEAINYSIDTITAIIKVTPRNSGCPGVSTYFHLIVNPSLITTQPQSGEICLGESLNELSVAYEGIGTPVYQWFRSEDESLTTYYVIDNETNANFTPPYDTIGTFYYFCEVSFTDISHGCNSIRSDVAIITINPTPFIATHYSTIIATGQTFSIIPENNSENTVPDGTTYTWSVTDISPSGTIVGASNETDAQTSISQTLTNTSDDIATVTYSVIPKIGDCEGEPFTVTVTVVFEVTVNETITNISCNGENDGAIVTQIDGGIPFEDVDGNKYYEISWSGPDGFTSLDPSIYNLNPGVYILSVKEQSGEKIFSYEITEPEAVQVTILAIRNVSCNNAGNGEIILNTQGGFGTLSYQWTKDGVDFSNSLSISDLQPGEYELTITDENLCRRTETFSIEEPNPLEVTVAVNDILSCEEQLTGTVRLIVSGGTEPYSFNWSTGRTTSLPQLSNLASGDYFVDIRDANGCERRATFSINKPKTLQLDLNKRVNFNCDNNAIKQVFTLDVSGGTPFTGATPYLIEWSAGVTFGSYNQSMETDINDAYVTVKVTDAIGCVQTLSFYTVIPKFGMTSNLINCNQHTYKFNAVVQNDQPSNYSFFWDFGDGTTSTQQNPEHRFANPGQYIVELRVKGICDMVFREAIIVEAAPNLYIPQLNADNEVRICRGDSVEIQVFGAESYMWNGNATLTGDRIVIKNPGAQYYVEGFTSSGCTVRLSFKVLLHEYNYSIITDLDEINESNNTVNFWTQFVETSVYTWEYGDNSGTNHGLYTTHTYENLMERNYFDIKLTVQNPGGCYEVATKRIWVGIESLPNTFSPNGDGNNDIFLKGWKIQIYNRNGILLYEGTDGWDGTHNGRQVPNDTYFYVVNYQNGSPNQSKAGYVTIIR